MERKTGMADAMATYAEAMRPMAWAMRNAQAMLELNQALFEINQDLFRRQQEAMMEATLRIFGAAGPVGAPDQDDVFAGFARLTVDAFDRMAAAMRASNDTEGATQPEREVARR